MDPILGWISKEIGYQRMTKTNLRIREWRIWFPVEIVGLDRKGVASASVPICKGYGSSLGKKDKVSGKSIIYFNKS